MQQKYLQPEWTEEGKEEEDRMIRLRRLKGDLKTFGIKLLETGRNGGRIGRQGPQWTGVLE
jgi:hypothetical protein